MTPNRGAQFIVGDDVLGSTRDGATNVITLQLGDVVDSDAVSQDAMLVQQPGMCSRPSAATAGRKAAQAYGIRQGDRDVVLGVRDSRSAAIYGELAEGETCVYADAGMARALFKADGSVTLLTTDDNTTAGTTMSVTLSPTQGFLVSTPWGGLSLGPDGFQVFTQSGTTWGGSIGLDLDGVCQITGPTLKCASGQVLLGMNATAATGCGYGVGTASLASTCVFVSP